MYPKNTLVNYGNALADATEKQQFLEAIQRMQTVTTGGVEMVMAGDLNAALKGTAVAHLLDELAQKWLDYADVNELPNIGGRRQ